MKKTALMTLLTGMICLGANAQDMFDAYKFSISDYEGTARTVAMGNAFTALGGDLGAVNINPASLAVSRYGQWTITPALTISVNKATGTVPENTNPDFLYFQKNIKNSLTRFDCPNLGASLNFETHRNRGIKNVTVGVVFNRTNSYQDNLYAKGSNLQTSMMGAMAAAANGITADRLDAENAWDSNNWKDVIAWKSGMISTFGDFADQYVGTSEKIESFEENGETKYDIYQAGMLEQSYIRLVTGNKNDCVINVGLNISDEIYLGANLGITSLGYVYDDTFSEQADNPKDFYMDYGEDENGQKIETYFTRMKYKYSYTASGNGVFGKFGIIYAPKGLGLRFGAAVQTPTGMTLRETWQSAGETNYENTNFNMSAVSPEGEYTYRLRTPLVANFGLAWTFGSYGVISADYELSDYSTMRFSSHRTFDDDFELQNEDIRNGMGIAHKFRAGVEVKPLPALALRAGYGLTTSGERYYENDIKKTPKSLDQTFGFGLGYSSNRSFFMDIACQARKYAKEYIYPYNDYIEGIFSPEIEGRKTRWNILYTIGFRF